MSGGSKKFVDLKGAARRNMLAGIAFVIGSLSMIGIPLTAGFVSKMYFATASIGMPEKVIPTLVVLSISTVLNALYYVPAIIVLFSKTDNNNKIVAVPDKKDIAFIISMVGFIILNFVLGICSDPFLTMIRQGLEMFG